MAVTAKWYGNGIKNALSSVIDLNDGNLKVMLTDSTYVPDQDLHEFKSSVTGEVVAAGYTAGGVALASVTVGYTAATNVVKLDAADVVWADITLTARTAVVYYDTGVAATSPLIAYQQSDSDVTSTAGDWTVTWNASGICTLTVS